jgi:hypothetical protein
MVYVTIEVPKTAINNGGYANPNVNIIQKLLTICDKIASGLNMCGKLSTKGGFACTDDEEGAIVVESFRSSWCKGLTEILFIVISVELFDQYFGHNNPEKSKQDSYKNRM